MTYKVVVFRTTNSNDRFSPDRDVFKVNSPEDITDRDGVLIITMPPAPVDYRQAGGSRHRIPATRGSQAIYPRGGWSKVIIRDEIEEPEDD